MSIKTSTIKSITPAGNWSNGKQTFNKFNVTLANGDSPDFSAIGDFKKSVGDVIYYTLDEKKNYAKLQQTPPDAQTSGSDMTQQQSIARSVGVNNAIQLVSTDVWQNADIEKKRQILTDVKDVSIYLYKTLITKPE